MTAPTDAGSRSTTRIARPRRAPWVVVAIAGALAAHGPGCGGSALVEDACIVTDDCANFSEREMEECIARGDGELDEAGIYGCEDIYLEALQCYVDEDDCNDPMACADEYLDYSDCISDARDENVEIEVEDQSGSDESPPPPGD